MRETDAAWAERTYGACALGDPRRVRRLVATATKVAAHPHASLPQALASPAGVKGAYRFFHQPTSTLEAITAPHRAATLAHARAQSGPVLLVQDTSEFDYSHHPQTTGLGPIGNGRGQGFLLHSVLAITPGATPAEATVLGVAHVDAFDRVPAPRRNETSAQIRQRPRESDCWLRATAAVGSPPPDQCWVLVGDRGADMHRLVVAAREVGHQVLIRCAHDRRARTIDGTATHVLTFARTLAAGTQAHVITVPATPGHRAREASLVVGWSSLLVRPPSGVTDAPEVSLWVIRVWELAPPPGVPAVEWVLLSSVPTTTESQAWERMRWYQHRWLIEEYHQALKTGCRVETAQLQTQPSLWALLGVCVPIAVRLLHLRTQARQTPEVPAVTVLDPQLVAVVAALTATPLDTLTAARCWQLIARLGGHQGRTRDGPPGWKTLWIGWRYAQTVLSGVRLAATLPSSTTTCG